MAAPEGAAKFGGETSRSEVAKLPAAPETLDVSAIRQGHSPARAA